MVVHQLAGVTTIRALPLAAGLLVASARRDGRIARECQLSLRTKPGAPAADVLAFSTYVWNERGSLRAAQQAKERSPAALVVFGGPSVPRRPERAAAYLREHPFIDVLVFGEGELAFRELLRARLDGRPLTEVAGLCLRDSGFTAPRARLTDFAETGSPYLDGTFEALLAGGEAPGAAILETNRGCPFSCSFCDWGQAIASKVNELPLPRLQAELDWIVERKIPYLYIVDANYGIRRRDLEIIRAIGQLKARTGYPQYVFFHLTKNATERHLEVVLALREAGIGTHLALSAQDFEPKVLAAVRRDNIRLDRALDLRRICHQRGIPTFNELILGLPEQSYPSFARSMAKAITPWPNDAFQLYLARVIENSEMGSPEYRARYSLETRQVLIASFHRDSGATEVPEVEEIVVATSALPVDDWQRAFKLGFFLAAAHNLRLLDVVLQVVWRGAGLDLRAFLEALLGELAEAPRESALGRIDAVLDRYAQAILAGEAMVLPAEGTGNHLWAVEDAVLLAALGAGDAFFDEVARFVRRQHPQAPVVEEAVRYQQFVTPLPGDRKPRRARFTHDFPRWRAAANDAPLVRRDTLLRWAPVWGVAAATDLRGFGLAYLGALHARLPTFELSPEPDGAREQAP